MKCAFDSTAPSATRARNGAFVEFELPWAALLPALWAREGPQWRGQPDLVFLPARPVPGDAGRDLDSPNGQLREPVGLSGSCCSFSLAGGMSGSLWPEATGSGIGSYCPGGFSASHGASSGLSGRRLCSWHWVELRHHFRAALALILGREPRPSMGC